MNNSIVVTNQLHKMYGVGESAVYALKNCSVEFEKGKFTAIIGTSGSGKSTLLNLLGGLDSATSGEVLYEGKNILAMRDTELSEFRRKHIGFVFQAFNLISELTAQENILFPSLIGKQKKDMDYYTYLTDKLGISNRLHHYPSELSGGQQQRVAIARALIQKPKVLLCDEPTGNLDKISSQEVLSLLGELQIEVKQTIIVVTHDPHIAEQADRIIQIEDGRII